MTTTTTIKDLNAPDVSDVPGATESESQAIPSGLPFPAVSGVLEPVSAAGIAGTGHPTTILAGAGATHDYENENENGNVNGNEKTDTGVHADSSNTNLVGTETNSTTATEKETRHVIDNDNEVNEDTIATRNHPTSVIDEKKKPHKRTHGLFGNKKKRNNKKEADDDSATSSSSLRGEKSDGKDGGDGNGKTIDVDNGGVIKEEIPTIGLFKLWHYATPLETTLNIIGLVLAAGAGATQPLMTLIFGRLTTSFTRFGTILIELQSDPNNAALQAEFSVAQAQLKRDSANNASYLVYIGIAMGFCTYGYMLIYTLTSEKISSRVRQLYLKAVVHSEVAFFDTLGPGEVATRIENDAHIFQTGISEKVPLAVSYVATFITGFILAFVQTWKLALALSSILPVIMLCGAFMGISITKYSKQALDHVASAGTLAEEAISSIRTVYAFNSQSALAGLFNVHISKAVAAGLKTGITTAIGLGSMFWTIYSAYALAFFFGGILVANGQTTSGHVVSAFLSVLIGSFSLAMLNPEMEAINKGRGSAAKLFATIERVPIINSASEDGLKPEHVIGRIEFQDVTFAYPSRKITVLKNFSQVFEAGQQTALVGASGSGKSTCVGLITRFYDPVEGRILLDGVDLRDLNIKWLRSQIAVVGQEPVLFEASIFDNIRAGLIGTDQEHASEAEQMKLVVEAAKMANAHDFIVLFNKGYLQSCGVRGSLLSGGQKSRVAIARAIVSNPRILLLDEATAALDSKSESIVTDALEKASRGRTTITVAHRLSTIASADKILVMGNGRLLEAGTHKDLTADPSSAYSQLVEAQKLVAEKQKEESAGEAEAEEEENDGNGHAEKDPLSNQLTRTQSSNSSTPEMSEVERKTTGRSIASEILAEKGEHVEEDDGGSKHGMIWLARRCYKINREYKWLYLAGFLASVCNGAVYPALAVIFGKAVSAFSLPPDQIKSETKDFALWYFIVAILAGIFTAIQQKTLIQSAETLVGKLRTLYFKSVLRRDIEFFDDDKNSSGTITSNLSKHPQNVSGIAGVSLGAMIQSSATVIVGMLIGLGFDARLAAIGIATIPLLVSAGWIRLKVVVLADEKTRKMHSKSAQKATEAVAAIKTVMMLTKENETLRIYEEELRAPFEQAIKTAYTSTALYAVSQALSFFVIGLVFWVGSLWLSELKISVSSFYTVLNSVVFSAIQAGNVFNWVPDISKARSSGNAIFKSIDAVPLIDAESTEGKPLDLTKINGEFVLENIHFRYPSRPRIPVLRGLSMRIPAGKYVAIVGPSGSGKSTTIQLISRFYDPLSGTVKLDGENIADYPVAEYRKTMSLVAQEPTLYSGSIMFNVKLGSIKPPEEVSDEEVYEACRQASILEFVQGLPEGFDTECGNRSSAQLSGGQKQRIALARALVSNPKILLLDEATSALDSKSERVVQAALDQATLAAGRTTISIAHRLSSIQRADIIYYIDQGRVQEYGDHQSLMAKKGKYAELVKLQTLSAM